MADQKTLLIEQIKGLVAKEYSDYLAAFENQDKQYILRHCYEYVCMKDIASGMEDCGEKLLNDLSMQRLQEIAACPHILDWIYSFWLKYEDSTAEEMKECVEDTLKNRSVPKYLSNYFR